MPIKNNEYPNMFTLMDPSGQNKGIIWQKLKINFVLLYLLFGLWGVRRFRLGIINYLSKTLLSKINHYNQ